MRLDLKGYLLLACLVAFGASKGGSSGASGSRYSSRTSNSFFKTTHTTTVDSRRRFFAPAHRYFFANSYFFFFYGGFFRNFFRAFGNNFNPTPAPFFSRGVPTPAPFMTNSSNGTLFPFEPPAEGGMFLVASNGMQYYGKENYRAVYTSAQLKTYDSKRETFTCKNGRVILDSLQCDLVDDCGDGSDERSPTPCNGKCSASENAWYWSFSALFAILAYCVEKEKWRDELRCVVWWSTATPLAVLSLTAAITGMFCSADDSTQEINWNICSLVFTGLAALTSPLALQQVPALTNAEGLELRKQQALNKAGGPDAEQATVTSSVHSPLAASPVSLDPVPVPPPAPQCCVLQIQVPPGAWPGTTLQVTTPQGFAIQVTVPPGLLAGQAFSAQYQMPAALPGQEQEQRPLCHALPPPMALSEHRRRASSANGPRAKSQARAKLWRNCVLWWALLLLFVGMAAAPSPWASFGSDDKAQGGARREYFTAASLSDSLGTPGSALLAVLQEASKGASPPVGGGAKMWFAPQGETTAWVLIDLKQAKTVKTLTIMPVSAYGQERAGLRPVASQVPTCTFLVSGSQTETGPSTTLAVGRLSAMDGRTSTAPLTAPTASKATDVLDVNMRATEKVRFLRLTLTMATPDADIALGRRVGLNELVVLTSA
jgi:hypothetical protein